MIPPAVFAGAGGFDIRVGLELVLKLGCSKKTSQANRLVVARCSRSGALIPDQSEDLRDSRERSFLVLLAEIMVSSAPRDAWSAPKT